MASVTITITDTGERDLRVVVRSEPDLPFTAGELDAELATPAQAAAVLAAHVIADTGEEGTVIAIPRGD
jgi:hypothetical protein